MSTASLRLPLSDDQVAAIGALVADHAGLDYPRTDFALVRRAIQQHWQRLPTGQTPDGYLKQLRTNIAELNALISLVTINETRFFRNPHHFRALRDTILPTLLSQPHIEPILRCWSAGCATGEEPYSLAITLAELPLPAGWRTEIMASDISMAALAEAQRGIYHSRRLVDMPPTLRQRYFTAVGPEQWELHESIRQRVTFNHFNLLTDTLPPRWQGQTDLILCENVLIYFARPAFQQAIDRFFETLRPGGYLFLGYSETLWNTRHSFQVVPGKDAFYYRKPLSPIGPQPTAPAPPPPPRVQAQPPPAPRQPSAAVPRPAPPRPTVNVSALFDQATILADEHRVDEAIKVAEQLLEADPLHAPTYLLLSTLHFSRGASTEAIAALRRAIYAAPQDPLPHFRMGLMLSEINQEAQAARAFRSALSLLERLPDDAVIEGFAKRTMIEACQRSLARFSA